MNPQTSQTIELKDSKGTTVPLDAAHQFTSSRCVGCCLLATIGATGMPMAQMTKWLGAQIKAFYKHPTLQAVGQ